MRAVVYAVVALDDAHAGILRRSAHTRIARGLRLVLCVVHIGIL